MAQGQRRGAKPPGGAARNRPRPSNAGTGLTPQSPTHKNENGDARNATRDTYADGLATHDIVAKRFPAGAEPCD